MNKTPGTDLLLGQVLQFFTIDLSLKRGWVVSTSHERRKIGRGIEVIPWNEVAHGMIDLGA